MRKRLLAVATVVILLLVSGLAVFLFIKNQDLNKQLKQLSTCKTDCSTCKTTCPTCKTDCSKCKAEDCQQTTPTTYPVKVYFSKNPDSIDDPTKVYPINRTAPTIAVATYAISQLIAGPTTQEAALGYFSDVRVRSDASNCNNNDFTIGIKDGVATLQFCRTFDAIGVMSDARAQETIKASLLQFPTIKKVIILSKTGDCQFDASGMNLCLQ